MAYNKLTYRHILLLAVMVISFGIYYRYDTAKTERILEELNEEYPALTFSEDIRGEVTRIIHPYTSIFRNHPHHAFVYINDSLKRRLHVSNQINQTTIPGEGTNRPLVLDDVLEEGDRLVKEPDSYVLSIYKLQEGDTALFTFEMTNDLGYPLKAE